MEQIVMIEQAQADLSAIIERVRNEKRTIILTDKDKLPVHISIMSNDFDNNRGKRLGGFLVNTDDTSAPDDFDRMFEDEIVKMFYGEDIEMLNKHFEKMAKTQSNL